MFDAGAIVGRLELNSSHWKKNIEAAKKDTRSFNGYLTRNAESVKRLGIALTGLGVVVSGISVKLTALAMNAVESENLFRESMGTMAKQTREWSNEFSKAVGVNSFEVRKMVGTFNVMMGSMGLTTDAAKEMSQTMTELAFDMSSFYNLRVEEAFTKLQAGISGEVEPLKRLGIIVNETTIKNWALTQGIIKQGQEMTEAQKVMARFGVIMEQTKVAQGDLLRTSDTLSNLIKRATSNFTELGILLGQALIPIATTLVSKLNKIVMNLKEWVKENPKLANTIMRLTALTGVLSITIGGLLLSLLAMKTVLAALGLSIGVFAAKIGLISVAVVAVYQAWQNWHLMEAVMYSFEQGVVRSVTNILMAIQKFFDAVSSFSNENPFVASIVPGLSSLATIADTAKVKLGSAIADLKTLDDELGNKATKAWSDWKNKGEESMTSIETAAQTMSDKLKNILGNIADGAEETSVRFKKAFDREFKGVEMLADTYFSSMGQLWSDLFYNVFTGKIEDAQDAFEAFGKSVLRGLADILAQWVTMQAVTGAKSLGSAIFKGITSVAGAALGASSSLSSASNLASGVGTGYGAATSASSALGSYYGYSQGIEQVPHGGLYKLHAGETVVPKYDSNKPEAQQIEIHNLITPEAVAAAMQGKEGEHVIINVINRDSLRNGITRREIFRR